MKYYLEIVEQLTRDEKLAKQPQIVRLEVSGRDQALSLYGNLHQQYASLFVGRTYVIQLHTCHHGEGIPCEVERLT